MRTQPVSFCNDLLQLLDGDLYLPDEPDRDSGRGYPGVVVCSGYQGLKDIHPARFARSLTEHGYAVLAFDYRGFGFSEGERGRLIPQEQVEDVRSSISFLQTVPEIDADRIAVVGWALGGAVAIAEAADDSRVCAVAAIQPIGDGERSTRAMHDEGSWESLLERIAADRLERCMGRRSERVNPFEIIRLDPVTREYVNEQLYKAHGFGSPVSLESADHLLRFRPDDVVARISPRPLLLMHGAENGLHLPEESQHLLERAGEPKRLELLEGKGHTEWMFDSDPTYQHVAATVRTFLDESFAQSAATA